MKLLLDEQFSNAIAQQLRKRGQDAMAVVERPELLGMGDEDLIRWATSEGRSLVTENARDFVPLHGRLVRDGERHGGLILTSNSRFRRDASGTGRLVTALDGILASRGRHGIESLLVWL